jgi:bifunctional UDP-N-acetylglucosamine pyrophosphorylase/glucosamine-1-phosphate N-acetyltransferase
MKDVMLKGVATVVLAAGKGTRMKSDLVKVLHPLLGVPMLSYPIELSMNGIGAERTIVVIGHQADRIQEEFKDTGILFALQEEQLGTGHAVLKALPFLKGFDGLVLILCGDVPLVRAETLRSFLGAFRQSESTLSVLTAIWDDPSGYGRVVRGRDGWLERIVEEKDATEGERSLREVNTGIYCIDASYLREGLKEIGKENAQREYYLTDLVEIGRKKGLRCSAFTASDPREVMGINTRIDLASASEMLRNEKLKALMLSGVTIIDPKSTCVDRTVEIGRDTLLYPNCNLEGKTRVGERCVIEPNARILDSTIENDVTIRSNSVITGSTVGEGASVGPFAHLRPLTQIRAGAKIGNFVEVKKSVIGKGSKANHLTYIGDSVVGEDVNIGAGTITCNYDGVKKHQTVIGDRVFVGSNVELVAPVKVGSDSIVGAGTTVTKDVPEGALAISRVKQKNIKGWKKRAGIHLAENKDKRD